MSTWARTASGDMVFPTIGNGAEALVSDPVQSAVLRIQDGLRLWLGNWKLDTRQGFPWPRVLANKNPNLISTANLIKKAVLLLGTPVVISVDTVQMVFDSARRNLQFYFAATANNGAQIIGGTNGPGGVPYVFVSGTADS